MKIKHKTVHAGCRGELVSFVGKKSKNNSNIDNYIKKENVVTEPSNDVTYNPYKMETFVYKNNNHPVKNCKKVYMNVINRQVNILE